MIVLMLTVQTLIVTIGESMVASLPPLHRVHSHQSLHRTIKIILNFFIIVIIMMIIIIIMVACPQVISPLHLGKKHGLSLEAMETPLQVLLWLV